MSKRKRNEVASEDGTYVTKKNPKMNIVAFILCVLIATIIWLYATNTAPKDREEERTEQGSSSVQAMTETSCEASL